MAKMVPLARLRIDGATQMRAAMDGGTVEDYAGQYGGDPGRLPPLDAVWDGKDFWIWDGFHRIAAARKAGLKELPVNERAGTVEDARWLACGANKSHGLRRSNEDKRKAVREALALKPDLSDRALAEHCGVSHEFVRQSRGKVSTVDTSKAGSQVSTVDTSKAGSQVSTVDTSTDETSRRTGSDGKSYPAQRRTPTPTKRKPGAGCDDDFFEEESRQEGEPRRGEDAPAEEGEATAHEEGQHEAGEEALARHAAPVDGWGIPIQPHAEAAFADSEKFKELLSAIQKAQKLFGDLAESPGGAFLTLPDVSSCRGSDRKFVHPGLERAYKQVKAAAPTHTVCPYQYAEAAHGDDCATCNGLNWTPALGGSIPAACVERARAAFGVTEGA